MRRLSFATIVQRRRRSCIDPHQQCDAS